jgi:hypothetical protein
MRVEKASARLLVYASRSHGNSLRSVNVATERIASMLGIGYEVVNLAKENTPTYVYYQDGEGEAIPIFCEKHKRSKFDEVYAHLRNMIFVLSFHPKHSDLRQFRGQLMALS